MNIVSSNLAIILLTVITNISKCKAQYSIKWNKNAPDQTVPSHQGPFSLDINVAISDEYAIIGGLEANSSINVVGGIACIYKRASNGTWYLAQKLQDAAISCVLV